MLVQILHVICPRLSPERSSSNTQKAILSLLKPSALTPTGLHAIGSHLGNAVDDFGTLHGSTICVCSATPRASPPPAGTAAAPASGRRTTPALPDPKGWLPCGAGCRLDLIRNNSAVLWFCVYASVVREASWHWPADPFPFFLGLLQLSCLLGALSHSEKRTLNFVDSVASARGVGIASP